jgi:hypothetical protein
MTIDCVPTTGKDIKNGFNCVTAGGFSANSLTLTDIGGSPVSYVENYWTNGDLIISLLLFILVMFEIIKFGFEFFFPKIMKIKRENT